MKLRPSLAGLVALAIIIAGLFASVPAHAYTPLPTVSVQVVGNGPYNLPRTGQLVTETVTITAPAASTVGTVAYLYMMPSQILSLPLSVTSSAGACSAVTAGTPPTGWLGFGYVACPLGALAPGQIVTITATYTVTAPAGTWLQLYAAVNRPDACCNLMSSPIRIVQP